MSPSRESGRLCAWDKNNWVYLLNHSGQRQSQVRLAKSIVQAVLADDSSACVVADESSQFHWLTPDLSPVWQRTVDAPILSVAMDSMGQVVAVADRRGEATLWNRQGDKKATWRSSRPLRMLAMAPLARIVIGAADFGFVAAFDAAGRELWRHAPVVNIGGLAVTEEGNTLLACFSEGIHRLDSKGKSLPMLTMDEPCRLISSNYVGDRLLCGGLNNQVILLNGAGQVLGRQVFPASIISLALDPLGQTFLVATADGRIAKYRIDLT